MTDVVKNKWLLAQTLDERVERMQSNDFGSAAVDNERASRLLKRWRNISIFKDDDLWRQFLESQNCNEETFYKILGEIDNEHQTPDLDIWFNHLHNIYKLHKPAKVLSYRDYIKVLSPLLNYFGLLLRRHAEVLIQNHWNPPFESGPAIQMLLAPLESKLRRVIQRTMILETNIARLQKRLKGDTSESRYQSFLDLLDDADNCLDLLGEYPVIARQCYEACKNWFEASKEFLEHLCLDHSQMADFFDAPGLGKLKNIDGNLGDSHKQGRSVMIAEFQNSLKLVYKPRSLAPDAAFQQFVEWFNEKGSGLDFKTFRVLDRHTHGWTEYIPFCECKTDREVERFYSRQGGWLAILFALAITDLHLENLIACGEYPVIIDLETVFHPRLIKPDILTADDLVIELLGSSVLSSGLMPNPQHFDGKVLDKSGIGAISYQELPFEIDGYAGIGTDEVHIEKVRGHLGKVSNRPFLNGQPVDFLKYQEQLQDGFRKTYRQLLESRNELLSAASPIEKFRDVTTRVVIRATASYASFLNESTHPSLCRNALDREFIFAQIWGMTKFSQKYSQFCPLERRQLLNGDIPYFTSNPQSHDLMGDGSCVKNAFAVSGLELALDRIGRMSEQDLELQSWLLDASLVSSSANEKHNVLKSPIDFKIEQLGDIAKAAADRLIATAVRKNGLASWIALRFRMDNSILESGYYRTGIIDLDLYSGLSGIALFLAHFAQFSGKKMYQEFAEEVFGSIEQRLAKNPPANTLGVFSGTGGLVYLYTHLGVLWNQPSLLDKACQLTKELLPAIEEDPYLDVISGAAGLIPVLVGLHKYRPQSNALTAAIQCGHNIERGEFEGFKNLRAERGLSHGRAGIAWALATLGTVTGDAEYFARTRGILNQERNLLKNGVWSDVPGKPLQSTWCHGAHGIALSRMEVYKAIPEDEIRLDAENALKIALSRPQMANHIICHGSIGNLEALQTASEVFPENQFWSNELMRQSAAILEEIKKSGFNSPLPPQVMEPGLMKGLAGIGLELLRIAVPNQVPSILTLSPPKKILPTASP